MSVIERTPAKVNLSLLVGPVGADGYHPLSTVFAPIDLWDELEFDLAVAPAAAADRERREGVPRGLAVVCDGIEQESNLVTRAVRAAERLTGWAATGTIVVRKGIPVGAGLGGGSSDAAAALRAVGRMVEAEGGPRIEAGDLARSARELGADVPFFLQPHPALAAGVGDVLEPLPLPALHLAVVLPDRQLSTARVYRTFDALCPGESPPAFAERSRRSREAWAGLAGAWGAGDLSSESAVSALGPLLQNDLERASFHLLPGLARLKTRILAAGAVASLMSGSGPTMFGLFASREGAEAAAGALTRSGSPAVAVATRT